MIPPLTPALLHVTAGPALGAVAVLVAIPVALAVLLAVIAGGLGAALEVEGE